MLRLMPALAAATSFMQAPQDTAQLREISVTATRSETAEAARQATAVSIADVQSSDRAAGRVSVDLLRDLPGVYVQQTSAGQGAVVLRGLLGNQVLLLVDGVPLNNGTFRDGPGQYLATIDPETIERIEVLRGPASVLYGSDAQGGVVNIITRPHPNLPGRSFRFSGNASSANHGVRGRVSAGWKLPGLEVAVGGSLSDAGDLRAGGGIGRQDPTGFETEGFDAFLRYAPSEKHHLTWSAQHFAMRGVPRYDRYVTFRAPSAGADFQHVFDPQVRQLTYLRYRYNPGSLMLSRLEVTASLSVQKETRLRRRLLDGGVPDSTVTRTEDDVYTPGLSVVGNTLLTLGSRMVALTWGGELYADRLESGGETLSLDATGAVVGSAPITRSGALGSPINAGRFPDESDATRAGVFLAAETDLLPRLTVSGGLRWSTFHRESDVGREFGGLVENTSSDLTGQLGLVFRLTPSWSLAARLAEGFRAPNLYDLTNVGSVPGGIVVPNPGAIPERSLSSEVSVRFMDESTAGQLTVYRSSIDDFIDRTTGTFQGDTLFDEERVFQGLNVAEADLWGLEAEALRRIGALEVRATVLFTRGDQTGAGGVRAAMAKIPPLKGSGSLKWVPPSGGFWLKYQLDWAGAQTRLGSRDLADPRIEPGGTRGYAVHGIRGGLRVTEVLEVSAGLDNISDKLYRDHASGVDNPGRHVWMGASWTGPF